MKWKYFGFGIIFACCIAVFFRVTFNDKKEELKNEEIAKSSEIHNVSDKMDDNSIISYVVTQFYPMQYYPIINSVKSEFNGNINIVSGGILLTGEQENIDNFIELLDQVDIAPNEYLIDVLLLSVDTNNKTTSGLSILIDTLAKKNSNVVFGYDSTGRILVTHGIGELMAFLETSNSKVKIEGRSQLSVLENHPAIIKSGEKRAVITNTSTDGLAVTSSYSFIDIGLSLSIDIMPGSTKDHAVLKIVQSADSVTGFTFVSGDQIPIIAQRSLRTSVRVNLGETVVLGGLSQKNILKKYSGIPILQNLPLIGALFRNSSEEITNSDLIIMLQPVITRDVRQNSAKKTYSKFLKIKKDF